MPSSNQRGIAQIILLVLLVVGIAVGVYLVQRTQIFRSKAGSNNIQWLSSSGDDPTNCVISQNGETVMTCTKVRLQINVPATVSQ